MDMKLAAALGFFALSAYVMTKKVNEDPESEEELDDDYEDEDGEEEDQEEIEDQIGLTAERSERLKGGLERRAKRSFAQRAEGRPDRLEGGIGDETDPEDLDADEYKAGEEVEMEHTNDPAISREIARDHLTEDPRYYTKLKKVEC